MKEEKMNLYLQASSTGRKIKLYALELCHSNNLIIKDGGSTAENIWYNEYNPRFIHSHVGRMLYLYYF